MTSAKDADLQAETCFICYKSNHTFKKYFDWLTKVNALNDKDEFNHFDFKSDSDSKTSSLFKSHWRDKSHIFVQFKRNSFEKELLWRVISDQDVTHCSEQNFFSAFSDKQWFHHLYINIYQSSWQDLSETQLAIYFADQKETYMKI